MKQLAKYSLNLLWSMKTGTLKRRILYYHSVAQGTSRSHAPAAFSEQLHWLRCNGLRGVTVAEFVGERKKEKSDLVGISFDDGYADNLDTAVPLLENEGFTATVFVLTGHIGRKVRFHSEAGYRLYPDRQMLSQQDLRELVARGFEVGSHGVSHRMLTRMPLSDAENEIQQSKRCLEDWLGTQVNSISFPNGQRGAFSDDLIGICSRAGYKTICTTMWGDVPGKVEPRTHPRCEMAHTDTLQEFKRKMLGQRDYRKYIDYLFDKSRVWTDD